MKEFLEGAGIFSIVLVITISLIAIVAAIVGPVAPTYQWHQSACTAIGVSQATPVWQCVGLPK